jgi:hypothetical protein
MANKLSLLITLLIGALTAGLAPGNVTPARASTSQTAMFEADTQLYANPTGTLDTLRKLGVGEIRVAVQWDQVYRDGSHASVKPQGFNGADPRAPQYDWTQLDQIVANAPRYGIAVDLELTGGAPLWATGAGKLEGASTAWEPSAPAYGDFVAAAGTRYSGHFVPAPGAAPLPPVHVWEIWNEPNFGPDLDPQTVNHGSVSNSPRLYRNLVDAGWSALGRTGHSHDTAILGNLDARGYKNPGVFGATKPVAFIRTLYCLDARLRPLRGRVASAVGCPTNAAGSRRFRHDHPGLFTASGFGDHPYPFATAPNGIDARDPDDAQLSQVPHMTRVLDAVQRAYGSGHRFAIYDNEYGYITNPPNHSQRFPSPALAAAYINWAEYIHYQNPRLVSFMQFLLEDPNPRYAPEYGGFASGLRFFGGKLKPSYAAYRLPVYLPVTRTRPGRSVLVWGCARPARAFGQRRVQIQLRSRAAGAFATVATVSVHNVQGYFETHLRLRRGGVIRLAWTYPGGQTVYSRLVTVTVR